MKELIRRTGIVGVMLAITACGGTNDGEDIVDPEPDPIVDDAPDPSLTQSEYLALLGSFESELDYDAANLLLPLPTGTARYEGAMQVNVSNADGRDVDKIFGIVEMDVELLLSGDAVRGSITDLNIINNGTPTEALTGNLNISGTLNDGTRRMTATASGTLRGNFGGPRATAAIADIDMSGNVRRISGNNSKGLAGTMDGTLANNPAAEDDLRLNFQLDGNFATVR